MATFGSETIDNLHFFALCLIIFCKFSAKSINDFC